MADDGGLMLNLSTGNHREDFGFKPNVQLGYNKSIPDQAPIVKFVAKPRIQSSAVAPDGKKVVRVVRKKASLTAGSKTAGKFNFISEDPVPPAVKTGGGGLENDGTDKPAPAYIKETAARPSKGLAKVNSKWRVTEKNRSGASITSLARSNPITERKPVKKGVQNSTVISSLFHKNPEVPVMEKSTVDVTNESVFSTRSFADLKIHSHLASTLIKDLDLTQMTEVQSLTIPLLLDKKDVLVKSQTGSGKTLAYAIPIVEKLQSISPKIDRSSGVFALVIVPTRELVLQTYSWFVKIMKPFTWVVPGYLIGGEKKKSEKARIRRGMNVLISTPGRLLDHLSSTKNLNLGRLHWLVMDEADRLLDMGYEKDVARIMSTVEEHFVKEGSIGKRQTVMVSATLSQGVEKLAGLALTNPEHVNMCEEGSINHDQLVMPSNLKQSYVIMPPKLRLVTLAAFFLSKCKMTVEKKILIFMTTQDMVDYHAELFTKVLNKNSEEDGAALRFYKLHGSMAQKDRTQIFKEFRDTDSGILLCTDVAARGLDLPSVDWIVQFNPPVTAEEYVHRVGRTARVGKCGKSLIFLSPNEAEFVKRLASRGISLQEMNPDSILKTLLKTYSKMSRSMEEAATGLQLSFEETVNESYNLYQTATKGYISFVRSYAAFPKDVRDVFNFQSLHLGHYAKSFALRDPPTRINSFGRAGKRDDKTSRFNTASQRNPSLKKRLAASNNGESGSHQPTAKERREMLSEFATGFDLPAPKKMKTSQ